MKTISSATSQRYRRNGHGMAAYFYALPERIAYHSSKGLLVRGDCAKIMPHIRSGCVDTIFADPPFNLGKSYGTSVNVARSETEYLSWCYSWLNECDRVLKPGGALFVYNLPSWNVRIANYLLLQGMQFRDWIVVDIKLGLPIRGRLYPSHYSLLYFTKGKPNTFHNIRKPIELCRHCGKDIHHYGGHRNAINPNGVNLSDVWHDITPVRHRKFKSAKRPANALSTKLLERVVEISTKKHDVVLDPFGGSGTTYVVCEKKNRKWIGVEIGATSPIIDRLKKRNLEFHINSDYVER